MRRITLLTDFGTADGYVGAVKGVIADRAPEAHVDDVSHDIPPGDIRAAAWALASYWRLYPPGTVHVAVVDPGVGGSRRALAAEVDERYFVAPDNGVLTRVLDDAGAATVVEIRHAGAMRATVSATFHGRDLFATAAAWLARGEPLDELGPAVADPVRLSLPQPTLGVETATGEVAHVDRFGNLITNIPSAWVRGAVGVSLAGVEVGPLRTTYVDVAPGELVALVGSAGLLEIAVRDGRASDVLGAGVGAPVVVRRSG